MGVLFESNSVEWLSVAVVLVTSLYYYYKFKYSFWKRKGVKYLKPSPPFGNTRELLLLRKSFAEVFKEFYDKCPEEPFVGLYQLTKPMLLIRDPELIKHVMVKDFSYFQDRGSSTAEKIDPLSAHLLNLTGSKWQSLRSKLTPTFTSGKIKMMFHFMTECADQLKEYLDEPARKGEIMEMKEIMAKFTTDIIGSCAFGLQCNSMKDDNSEFRTMGRRVFESSTSNMLRRTLRNIAPSVMKLLHIKVRSPDIIDFFIGTVKEMVEYREKNNVVRNDFMQLLIQLKNEGKVQDDAKHGEILNGQQQNGANGINKKINFEFTDNLLASQAFIFFLAGFETSSTALSFCLHELAANPDVQAKLRGEIDSTLQKYDGKITYDGIQGMFYLDKVVDETLRKHPPAPIIGRIVTKPYVIPNTSVHLHDGQSVMLSVYGLHHDPKYYPDPERFDPERFSEEAKSTRPQYTYLPFGAGPRNCIGLRFGLLQTKVGLTILLSNYEFSMCEKTEVPIKLDPKQVVTSSKTGTWLKISKRN